MEEARKKVREEEAYGWMEALKNVIKGRKEGKLTIIGNSSNSKYNINKTRVLNRSEKTRNLS